MGHDREQVIRNLDSVFESKFLQSMGVHPVEFQATYIPYDREDPEIYKTEYNLGDGRRFISFIHSHESYRIEPRNRSIRYLAAVPSTLTFEDFKNTELVQSVEKTIAKDSRLEMNTRDLGRKYDDPYRIIVDAKTKTDYETLAREFGEIDQLIGKA